MQMQGVKRQANLNSRSGDMSMDEDSGVERRRNNYPRNDRNGRDRRDGRDRRPRDSGRLNADVDSYRPGGDRYGGLCAQAPGLQTNSM